MEHVNHGVIQLEAGAPLGERLRDLSDSLAMILKRYSPSVVVIEKIFLGKSADSAFKLGHARGIAMSEASRSGASIVEYATREVKKAVTGNGGATKEEVQLALRRMLSLSRVVNFDGTDALALTVCHAQKIWTEVALAGQNQRAREKEL